MKVKFWQGHSSLTWPPGAESPGSPAARRTRDERLSRSGPSGRLRCGRGVWPESEIRAALNCQVGEHPQLFALSFVLGFLVNVASFLVIKRTSSVMLKLMGTARNASAARSNCPSARGCP